MVQLNDAAGVASGGQITIQGWFGNSAQVVETFRFADGTEVAALSLTQMMASFGAPSASTAVYRGLLNNEPAAFAMFG